MIPSPRGPGLYVHLPFCSAICPYCDFYVLTGEPDRRQRFSTHLLAEIALIGERPWPKFIRQTPAVDFDTLYLGGGTPSILSPELLGQLLDGLHQSLPIVSEPWVALEANPEDVTAENVAAWQDLGVNFLSLGIQSFADRNLEFLGRRHRSPASRRSVTTAREGAFDTLSIDLIYGLPDQSATDWQADLEAAVDLRPDHLSCYQLTIEKATPFGYRQQRGQLTELSHRDQAELFFLTHRFLADHGFSAYEVSNFATSPDHRSRHNIKYWDHTPYLGLGPSAHSFAGRDRWWNERKIKPYEISVEGGQRPIEGHEALTPAQLCLERLLLGLRTCAGVDLDAFADDMGQRIWQSNHDLIADLSDRQLLVIDGQWLRPTLAGLALAESIARDFEIEGA